MSNRSSEVSPPVRSLPRSADVVVIGGGVVGLCSAYELAAHGRQVVVIDEGPIARGSAAGNAGLITPSHLIPMAAPGVMSGVVRGMIRRTGPVTVRPSIDPSYLRWMVRFARNCTSRAADAGTVVLRALGFPAPVQHHPPGALLEEPFRDPEAHPAQTSRHQVAPVRTQAAAGQRRGHDHQLPHVPRLPHLPER